MEGPIVFESPRFVAMDVSDQLPRHRNYPWNWRKSARHERRIIQDIRRVILHHSAGNIWAPPRGIQAQGRYFVRDPPIKDGKPDYRVGRGWPGFGYTCYLPYAPLLYEGRPIVYQCQPWTEESWHTKGGNETGVALEIQGSFSNAAGGRNPSPIQQQLIGPVVHEWLLPTLGLTSYAIRGHCDYTKPTCPGWWLERWLRAARAGDQWPSVEEQAP